MSKAKSNIFQWLGISKLSLILDLLTSN